jgi:hypothetical protein
LAIFSIHFDGPIVVEHKVSIRVLANTYERMQRAIDRSYLIQRYGDVWKHARLKANQYPETEFIAEYPREGGIILDAVRAHAGPLLDRIADAIRPAFDGAVQQALDQHASIDEQLLERRNYVQQMAARTPTFEAVTADPPPNWASAYSNRSIVKEIDQLVTQVTPVRLEGSTIELLLQGERAHLPFLFDAQVARGFHRIAARRELASPMIVTASIRILDKGNRYAKPNAKILNLTTEREVKLHLSDQADFDLLHPHHNGQAVRLYVCPIVEALGFDLNGGDLLFIGVAE